MHYIHLKKVLRPHKLLIILFLIALFLRTYQLSTFPIGFHADEVRVGWNAYSILKTGLDDRGNKLALYYNTFGDYRPTGIFYITIPALVLFGTTEFAVRLPSALFGALTVFPLYALVFLLFTEETKNKKTIAILSALFLTFSPWHIATSRATSEVVISLFFALVGLALFLKGLKDNHKKSLYWAFSMFIISYLFYHSIRLLAPIFIGGTTLFIWFSQKDKMAARRAAIFFATICLLTLVFMANKASIGRFSQVSVTYDKAIQETIKRVSAYPSQNLIFDNNLVIYGSHFVRQYLGYFTADFLIGTAAKPLRYTSPDIGVLTYFEFLFFLIGFVFIIYKKHPKLPILFLLLAPLAAALTTEDAPNLHRSLLMIAFIAIIMGYGVKELWGQTKIFKAIAIFLLLGLFLNFSYFWQVYTTRAPFAIAAVRNYQAKAIANYIFEVQQNYEQVILTNDPDDLYPWYAFFNKLNPSTFNQFALKRSEGPWVFENLLFTQSECPSGDVFPGMSQQPLAHHVLVVDGFRCPVESKLKDGMQAKVVKQFKNPDGTIAYTLWEETKE